MSILFSLAQTARNMNTSVRDVMLARIAATTKLSDARDVAVIVAKINPTIETNRAAAKAESAYTAAMSYLIGSMANAVNFEQNTHQFREKMSSTMTVEAA